MNSLGNDITSVLNHYVKRKSLGEIQFDMKQKDSGVKVCEHIIHQHSNKEHGKDKLRLIAQISHVSDNCDTPIPTNEKPVFNDKQDSSEQLEKSPQISDYYLKTLSLTHIKSKSLDNDRDAKVDIHRTKVTTVIGDSSCKYERVHNTTLIHSANGNKIEKEHSFTRHVASSNSSSNSRPSSYYSLPSQIHHSSLIDKLNNHRSKKKGKFKWRRIFSLSKSPRKNEVNLKEIDNLAIREVNSLHLQTTESMEKWNRQDSKKSNLAFNIKPNLPFKSYPIGRKLQPLHKDKKTKKVPHFFSAILNSESFLPKPSPKKTKGGNIKNKKHTIDMDQVDDRATKVVVDVQRCGEDEKCRYQINPDDYDFVDGIDDDNSNFINEGSNRQRSMSGNISYSHIDMLMNGKSRRPSCPAAVICNCHDRRIDLISEFIRLAINKRKNEQMLNKISTELSQCDKKSYHFTDCVMGKCLNDNDISKSIENWRQSLASLYSTNTCSMCNDIDEQLNENFSHTLLPLIAKLENDEEINCPVETIEYFIRATCYKHFEKGLFKIIGSHCTIKNVALLHYLTRRIVKHIGDPTDEDDKRIKNILKYSEKFYIDNFYPHIKNIHKSMESFLISSNDNDDVD